MFYVIRGHGRTTAATPEEERFQNSMKNRVKIELEKQAEFNKAC